MISTQFQSIFDESWIATYLPNKNHELIILNGLIPWKSIVLKLVQFYKPLGSYGKNLRMMISIHILMNYRQLSDRKIILAIQENRYAQFFCHVEDRNLSNFVTHSSISNFRNRIGPEGVEIIESEIFKMLFKKGAIRNDLALIDSSVLPNNIVYPNDVQLLKHALVLLERWSLKYDVPLWFDIKVARKLWRAYRLKKRLH